MTLAEREEIWLSIYQGAIGLEFLPEELYLYYGVRFNSSLTKGFGATLAELTPGTKQYELLSSLKGNVNNFTGCKTFQYVKGMESLKNLSLDEFKVQAKALDNLHYEWSLTENRVIDKYSVEIKNWQQYQEDKEDFPFLRYSAVLDGVTRDEHAALDGIERPVDDDIWSSIAPPDGYGCRCTLEQKTSSRKWDKPLTTEQQDVISNEIPEMFKRDIRKIKQIFPETGANKHNYFKVPKRYENMKKVNWGMPIL